MMWFYSSSSSSIFVLPIASAAASALLLGGVFSIILAKLVSRLLNRRFPQPRQRPLVLCVLFPTAAWI